jgi:diguanylate cyclase (GGDEF)-like protein/PAS domain S-box-containing protein
MKNRIFKLPEIAKMDAKIAQHTLLKCLLVDDNPDDRALATRALEREFPEMQTEFVTDMDEFKQRIQTCDLDLVITDYQLRWTDGLSVLRMIKQVMPECPVVMFTGTGSEEIAVEAMHSGLDEYVLKAPGHYALLPTRVRSLLARAEQKQLLEAAENALRESEARLRAIINTEPECVKIIDSDHHLQFINASGLAMIEADSSEQVVGKKLLEILLPEYRQPFQALTSSVLAGNKGSLEFEITGLKGHRRWLESHAVPLVSEIDGSTSLLSITRDITERKQAESGRAQLAAIINSAIDFIGICSPDGTVTFVNQAGRHMLGIDLNEDLSTAKMQDFLPARAAESLSNNGIPIATHESMWRGESALCWRNSVEIPVSAVIVAHKLPDGSVDFFSTIMRDISERKHHEEQLQHLATHDILTGLPNRALYSDRLEVAILEAQRHQHLVAAMHLNLDRFKTINDTLGHDMGNALLQAVAERLEKKIRDDDTIARLGSDEFALVFTDIAQLDDVSALTQEILHSFKKPFRIGEHELFLTASVGIALYPLDDLTPDGLLKNAAIALNRSKDNGGNTYQYYTAEMNAKALQHLLLDNALHHALERDELQLYYQPQVDFRTGKVCGMEALLRWKHPELGMISPAEFIPLAEKTGLIVPIGEWVLRTACAQCKAWQMAGLPALPVAVNLSGRQFAQLNLAQIVTEILTQTGLSPDMLELEITEGTLIQNIQASITMLNELNSLGIAISIDDFGTGYSSLSYLKRFPINAIKIDQSFVRDIYTDPNDAAIVSAIIAMARSLGMKTIAEGVETNEQLTFLRSRQCDQMQGYYFSRPVPAEVITQMLNEDWCLSFMVNS